MKMTDQLKKHGQNTCTKSEHDHKVQVVMN